MSAIGGFWRFSGPADAPERCRNILAAQQIYAPDAPAFWSDGDLSLGRRLLQILPEDRFDRGPVQRTGGRWTLVADARLDNRDELARQLGVSAAEQTGLADSAILLLAIEQWGEDAVDRLVGDFSFAAWDSSRRRLLLARDFLGQRPLHYHRGAQFFAFASMPKGLLAVPEIPAGADEEKAAEFLALMPEADPSSFFKSVKRVLPGEICVVTATDFQRRFYWRPSREPLRLSNSDEYAEAVRESLDRAVADRLRGTGGNVGAHLSGGLDSSAVAATAARLMPPEGRVMAFTSVPREGYSEPLPTGRFGDEGPLAAQVAALYPNMEHILIRSGNRSPVRSLDRNFFLYDRPLLNLCNHVWLEAILDAAKERRLRVLLAGQMGNMTFSYSGLHGLAGLLGRGSLMRLGRESFKLWRGGSSTKSVAAGAIGPFLPGWMWRSVNRWAGRHTGLGDYSALHPARHAEIKERAVAAGLDVSYRPRRDPIEARLWTLRRIDPGNFNKGQLGGWGIDVRDPTSDRRLVELCLSIPAAEYLRDGQTRAIARRAFSDRLPAALLEEKRKGLQAVDWHEGLAAAEGDVAAELQRIAAAPGAAEVIDLARLAELAENLPSGGWHSSRIQGGYRLGLLRGLSTGHFLRKASGSNA
jgi:asparagine synthase (glutamine-hydrolysing)